MRRFVQTFVLAPQSAKKYYVRNDIFRYQVLIKKMSIPLYFYLTFFFTNAFKDDAFSDDEDGLEERPMENEISTHPTPVSNSCLAGILRLDLGRTRQSIGQPKV